MPTYEYACRSCGHTFEIVQSMSDDALTTCPRCQGELRKVFAPPAIAFKGSGFYATDHGKKSSSTDRSSDTKPEGPDAKGPKKDGSSSGAKDGSSSGSKDGSSSGSGTTTPKKEATPS